MELSYCVVNTNGRDDLLACLAAIRDLHPPGLAAEVLVLDNASDDGSAEAAAAWIEVSSRGADAAAVQVAGSLRWRLLALDRRAGKAENDTLLLREATGELCLLLNEDTALRPGAVEALVEALRADPGAGAAGAQLLDPAGAPQPCAWRLPSLGTAIAWALFAHRAFTVQSRGSRVRPVGWVQSAAMIVRRDAVAEVSYLDPEFFVYSDETDLCKRLADAGWRTLYVPAARAVHHEQLGTDRSTGSGRVVEFHRNRDLYMRKHHSRSAAALVRVLSAWPYLVRAAVALALPGHDPRWYLLHARLALRPRGRGLREAAAERNRALAQAPPRSSSRSSAS